MNNFFFQIFFLIAKFNSEKNLAQGMSQTSLSTLGNAYDFGHLNRKYMDINVCIFCTSMQRHRYL